MTSPTTVIACAKCASLKVRCDKKIPCTQCVTKGVECQPRTTSRQPRRPRTRRNTSSQTGGLAAMPTALEATSLAATSYPFPVTSAEEHMPAPAAFQDMYMGDWFQEGGMAPTGQGLVSSAAFLGSSADSVPRSMDLSSSSHGAFSGGGIAMQNGVDADLDQFAFPLWSCPQYSSTATTSEENSRSGTDPSSRPTRSPAAQGLGHWPSDPASSPAVALERWPYARCNPEEQSKPLADASQNALQDLTALLARRNVWQNVDFEPVKSPPFSWDLAHTEGETDDLSSNDRDCLLAALQGLLRETSQVRNPYTRSSGDSQRNLVLGPIVQLPPSRILVRCVELYASRVEPYLDIADNPEVRISDILKAHTTDFGAVLTVLLIAQGAMLADHPLLFTLANGLSEACRRAVEHFLARDSIAHSLVGGSTLQLLSLCAWSGCENLTMFALEKRAHYLSMLEPSGLLQEDENINISEGSSSTSDITLHATKCRARRQRLAFAWFNIDFELSLFFDKRPILSVHDMNLCLPKEQPQWLDHLRGAWPQDSHDPKSRLAEGQTLPDLFRSFLQGRLARDDDTPQQHLRLLFHPLQAMVLEQQGILRLVSKEQGTSGHPAISRLTILGRLQDTQRIIQHMRDLLSRSLAQSTAKSESSAQAICCMILLHLLSLNSLTCNLEIEQVAKQGPSPLDSANAEVWQHVHYSETEHPVIFHAGQIFRLTNALPKDASPPWWPLPIYRAALACWSFSFCAKSQVTDGPPVAINSLSEDDPAIVRYVQDYRGTAVFRSRDGLQIPVLEGANSLDYCISLLEGDHSRLVYGVRAKMKRLRQRWTVMPL